MNAILFAAGKGTRCWPLTLDTPKPLLRAAGKTILEHNLDQLAGIASEARIVVGYRGDEILRRIGTSYKGISIAYIEQQNPAGGTGEALLLAAHDLEGKLLVMNGDDFYSRGDIERALKHDRAALATDVPDKRPFGVLELSGDTVTDIIEKPPQPGPGTVAVGVYVLQSDIIPHLQQLQPGKGGERWLPDALREYLKQAPLKVERVQDYWLPIGYPEQLLRANKELLDREVKTYTMPQDYPHCVITGPVEIGTGTVIKPFTVIEGPVRIGRDCVIGPAAYLRPYTTLGDRCHVGHASEVKNSILGDQSNAPHRNFVGDSVIGDRVNLGNGSGTMNLRTDGKSVPVKDGAGAKRDSGLRKLGAIIGNNVKIPGNLPLYPGTVIPPNTQVLLKDGKLVYEPLPPQ
jgi:bifunctional UDP-N-acetylglucosamine pyrophosphorylase/glucosamine-1-phosphate N-acetyltransferase